MNGNRGSHLRRTTFLAAGLTVAFLIASGPVVRGAAAQDELDPADSAGAADIAGTVIEALRCWRRVGRNAVHVGERFDMLVTCSVAETESARAVPDLAGFEPESLAVSPFEVLEGRRYDDLVRGPRRFLQYRYALRIIGEDYFGTDVELPELDVRYRIERSLDGGAAIEGRELAYTLPPEPVRVLALVPAEVADIRELPGETFGDAEARLFRANLAALGAAVLTLAAAAAAFAAALGAYRSRRGAGAAGATPLPVWRAAGGALGELNAVREVVGRAGWGAAELGRAVTALRVAGAIALGRPLVQTAAAGAADDDGGGQLVVPRGHRRGAAAVTISSAVTPEHVDRAFAGRGGEPLRDARLAEAVRDALRLLGRNRYGRPADPPGDALTAQLDRAIAALADYARQSTPAARRLAAIGGRRWGG